MIGDGNYGLQYSIRSMLHIQKGHSENGLKPNAEPCLEMLRGENGPYTSTGGYRLFALYEESPDYRATTLRKQEIEHDEPDTLAHVMSIRDSSTFKRLGLPFHLIGQTTLPPIHTGHGNYLFYRDEAFAHLEGQSGPLVWSAIPLTTLRRSRL